VRKPIPALVPKRRGQAEPSFNARCAWLQ
jgi:hypothetical protein